MRAITKKLWRELWHMRGQALAILLVVGAGVGVCVMSISTYDSLLETRDNYYRDYGFAHVFASLKRAPEPVLQRVAEIPGVAAAQSRVVAQVNLAVPGFDDPITATLISLPSHGQPSINRMHLAAGRWPDSRRDNEVLVSDAFAEAHKLSLDSRVSAIINGRQRELQVVGIALSPEYIYQIAPGALMPDYLRYAVVWMPRRALAQAYDMDGAFNDVVVTAQRGASWPGIIEQLDVLLGRYGGGGAYDREDQYSNRFLREDFNQLKTMATLFPVIFLGVAVFLLNVVVTRLVSTQRDIIAVLKAFGYSNGAVAWHYAQLILLITGFGIIAGIALGVWLGQGLTGIYAEYYRFPELLYRLHPTMLSTVAGITLALAMAGTLRAVLHAAALPPAEAMRPEAPARYSATLIERLGLQRYMSQPMRMILRHLQRRPMKSGLSVLGIAMACAIMMVGNFQQDSVNFMSYVQFSLAQKQDLEVNLNEPMATGALDSLRQLDGVWYVEGLRSVPVRLRFGTQTYRLGLQGLPEDLHLQVVLDQNLNPVAIPEEGVLLTEHLARKLGVKPGDWLTVEVLEGARSIRRVPVAALTQQYLGLGAYMRLESLNRLLREGPAVNVALLQIDQSKASSIYKKLRDMPRVAGVNLRQSVIDSFRQTLEQTLLLFTFINATLGAVVAFGVVYNTVRISLAERGRELASLRVLGYTHSEVAYVLLGELALLTVVGIPLGFGIGMALCAYMADSMQSDLYRVPLVLSAYNFAFSALVVIASAAVSGALVWWRLKQLDLVEVLKTRE